MVNKRERGKSWEGGRKLLKGRGGKLDFEYNLGQKRNRGNECFSEEGDGQWVSR